MTVVEAVWQYAFLRNALVAGLLLSLPCGIMGTYVVTRRITYIAGAIAHCILGGMGAAQYARVVYGWTWATPFTGATASALLAAMVIGWVSLRAKQREDTVIGALWALGMAIGILFISRTPGYSEDLMAYLFGNILMISQVDLLFVVGLAVVVLVFCALSYSPLLTACFDEELARLRGIHVEFYYLALLCLVALTVVLLVSLVGIVLVIALLTLPAAIAGHFSKTMRGMMFSSVIISAALTSGGILFSYQRDLPAGATITALAGLLYLATAAITSVARR